MLATLIVLIVSFNCVNISAPEEMYNITTGEYLNVSIQECQNKDYSTFTRYISNNKEYESVNYIIDKKLEFVKEK